MDEFGNFTFDDFAVLNFENLVVFIFDFVAFTFDNLRVSVFNDLWVLNLGDLRVFILMAFDF